MRKIFLVLVGLFCLINSVKASERLSLDDCLKMALSNNPGLSSIKARLLAAEDLARAAQREKWPTLSARYNFLHLRDQQKVVILGRDIPLSAHEKIEFDLLWNFPVFHGFSIRVKERLKELEANLASVAYQRALLTLSFQVKEAYYDLLKAERGLREAQKSLERLKAHLKKAESFYQEGLIAKHQVLEAEVAVAQAEHAQIVAQNLVEIARGRLNILLNRNVATPIEIQDDLENQPYLKDYEFYLKEALKRRPEIRAAEIAIEKAKENVRLAKSSYYPWIDIQGIYQKQGPDLLATRNPYGDRENIYFGVEIKWLLWDWGKRKREVSAARAQVFSEEAALKDIKNQVSLEVRSAYLEFRAAEKRLKVANEALNSAQENYRLHVARFKEGLSTTTDVLDAESFLTSAQVRRIQALADLKITYAKLLYATGHAEPKPF
ncbi:TolC family protein [Thermodesulfatator autotrophicus]|uniref:Transporter n=1 Tax=Thermodesulfatator autotrophicus TaxID=1795632 RepID=A0A177E5K5_9BACT|nr:TolC family protein [Thermodesulfatator autotrophicus]OAG27185.1 hypothetical protein TH606_08220 [Thermodesulfatator autotrophicus]